MYFSSSRLSSSSTDERGADTTQMKAIGLQTRHEMRWMSVRWRDMHAFNIRLMHLHRIQRLNGLALVACPLRWTWRLFNIARPTSEAHKTASCSNDIVSYYKCGVPGLSTCVRIDQHGHPSCLPYSPCGSPQPSSSPSPSSWPTPAQTLRPTPTSKSRAPSPWPTRSSKLNTGPRPAAP